MHVIVAVYPPALENEKGEFCPQGNAGLTVATFGAFWTDARACEGTLFGPFGFTPGVIAGVITAYRGGEEAMRDVEAARVKLNSSLAAFALNSEVAFDVVNAYTPDFQARGVCATTDGASRPPEPNSCFTAQDLMNLPCAPGNPPSSSGVHACSADGERRRKLPCEQRRHLLLPSFPARSL